MKVVHAASAPAFEHYVAEVFAPAVSELVGQLKASFVVGAATAAGRDLLPRVAAKLGAAMATDVTAVAGAGSDITFHRPMWAGAVIAEVKMTTAVQVVSVRATEFAPAAAAPGGRGETVCSGCLHKSDGICGVQGSQKRAT